MGVKDASKEIAMRPIDQNRAAQRASVRDGMPCGPFFAT